QPTDRWISSVAVLVAVASSGGRQSRRLRKFSWCELVQLPGERLELRGGGTVARVDVHDLRAVRLELGLVVLRIGDHDDAVTRVHEPGGSAVEDDVAGT